MARERTRSEVRTELPISADYSVVDRELFWILLIGTFVLFVFTQAVGFLGRKGTLVPVMLFALLIVGGYWRHRRLRRLLRAVVLTESSIESIGRDGDRIEVPWTGLERVEWIQSGPDSSGGAGLRIISRVGTVRVYRHIRRFEEIARIVLKQASSRRVPIELPPAVSARLLSDVK